MKDVWLFQVVSPGLKLQGLARKFDAESAFIMPPSHVDHPNRLVMGLSSSQSRDWVQEELEFGDSGKYAVGFCVESWGPDYPLNDPELVPLQLNDPLLAWALERSPTGAKGFDRAAADAWAAEHPGQYFFRHSADLPPWEPARAALKVRPLDEITVSAFEFPWNFHLDEAALPEEQEANVARAQQAGARVPVGASKKLLYEILARY